MSLAELKEDFDRQVVMTGHHFERPRDVLAYINEGTVKKEEKVTIDMCVLSVDERELCWHVNLIDKSEDPFDARKELIEKFSGDLRGKYVFCLALWKSKKQSREHVVGDDYQPGRSYVIDGVHTLQTFNGVPQGSVQARLLVKSEGDDRKGKTKRKTNPKP